MDWMFGDESHSDSCKTGRDIIQKSASYLAEKDTGEQKSEGWVNCFSVDAGSCNCGVYVVLNCRGGAKCAACGTELLGREEKLDVCVSAYRIEALASSKIGK